jgi:hypothetical protein
MAQKKWQKAIHAVFENLKPYDTSMPIGLERQFILDNRIVLGFHALKRPYTGFVVGQEVLA